MDTIWKKTGEKLSFGEGVGEKEILGIKGIEIINGNIYIEIYRYTYLNI